MPSCMQEIKTQDQYEKLKKTYPELVIYYKYEDGQKKCEPCKVYEPKLEHLCEDHGLGTNTPVAVATCNLKYPFCKNIWLDSKPEKMSDDDYGIPAIQGIARDQDHKHPNFMAVVGSQADEKAVSSFFEKLGKDVEKITGKIPPIRQKQASQQNAPIDRSPFSLPKIQNFNQNIHNLLDDGIDKIRTSIHQLKADDTYEPTDDDLCTPGVNCDYNTFNKKALSWALN